MKKTKLELKDKPIKPLKRTMSLVIGPKKIVLILFILFLIEVLGKTEPMSYLTINGEETYINREGNFKTEIELSEGLNIIKINSKNRFGKTNEIIRRILYGGTKKLMGQEQNNCFEIIY